MPKLKDDRVRARSGLKILPLESIGEAINESEKQINRLTLAFVSASAFCILYLFTPDSAFLDVRSSKITLPFAGPVSFEGFMLLGPPILIAIRLYIEAYTNHAIRLNRVLKIAQGSRVPTLLLRSRAPLKWLNLVAFYILLPLTTMGFCWKAAISPSLEIPSACLLGVALTAFVPLPSQNFLRSTIGFLAGRRVFGARNWLAWGCLVRGIFGLFFAVLWLGVHGAPRRPMDLFRVDLADSWLPGSDLRGANLQYSNLHGAFFDSAPGGSFTDLEHAHLNNSYLEGAQFNSARMEGADLSGVHADHVNLMLAGLSGANLQSADLTGAVLVGTDLRSANLSGSILAGADLATAHLSGANLRNTRLNGAHFAKKDQKSGRVWLAATGLTQAQLTGACGTDVILPPGFPTLSPCSK
jgi:uncharacterized protein YjbI with pentapeptide repeats